MQQIPSHPILSPPTGVGIPADDPTASFLFDWSDFLDFNLDEGLHTSFSHAQPEQDQPGVDPDSPDMEKPGQVRKRDPRLACSNFLAGRVPCTCPELDAKLEEEERLLLGKKRSLVVRPPAARPGARFRAVKLISVSSKGTTGGIVFACSVRMRALFFLMGRARDIASSVGSFISCWILMRASVVVGGN